MVLVNQQVFQWPPSINRFFNDTPQSTVPSQMEAATSQFYFFLFFCEQTTMPLIKTPPQNSKLDWRDCRSINYTLTVHRVTCSNTLRTNTEDTPNNAATLKTLPLHTTVLLRMVSSSRSSSVYEWIKELDSTNVGADVETNDMRFQQLKKTAKSHCRLQLHGSLVTITKVGCLSTQVSGLLGTTVLTWGMFCTTTEICINGGPAPWETVNLCVSHAWCEVVRSPVKTKHHNSLSKTHINPQWNGHLLQWLLWQINWFQKH